MPGVISSFALLLFIRNKLKDSQPSLKAKELLSETSTDLQRAVKILHGSVGLTELDVDDADVVVEVGVVGVERQRRLVRRLRVGGATHLDQDVASVDVSLGRKKMISCGASFHKTLTRR